MRPYTMRMTPPFTMIGSSVAVVEVSKHPSYPKGSTIIIYTGWVERGIAIPDEMGSGRIRKAADMGSLSKSLLLGACGMPGNTAYFGLSEICNPKAGETVVISGAAGAVGSLVGQIAKIKGCRVVGIAGGEVKCDYLVKELGFDAAVNYKKDDIMTEIRKAAPDGVDCYFDNIGGDISNGVINCMNMNGRIAVCGASAGYNATEPKLYPSLGNTFIGLQLKMEGFQVWKW